jgi:hypothetical protein
MVVTLKIAVSWDVTFVIRMNVLAGSEGGGSKFLENVGSCLPNYKALHPRRQDSYKLIIFLFSDRYFCTISYSTGSFCIDI